MDLRSNPRLSIAIIGSGKIGTDLLIKSTRSPWLRCELFIGRDAGSQGLAKARSLGVAVSDRSIDGLLESSAPIELVFDATSAEHHRRHAPILASAGMRAVDLTPARVGELCVPALNGDAILDANNVNMVTCGGQASIPVITTLARAIPGVRHVDVHSLLAEDSIGPGTLANLDDYYLTTAAAIRAYAAVPSAAVALEVERSGWKPDMLTTIKLWVDHCDEVAMHRALELCLLTVRAYVPGYAIVGTPRFRDGAIELAVSVRGAGDWIPSYAGNLDIINCAAIAAAERYARYLFSMRYRSDRTNHLEGQRIDSTLDRKQA